MSSEEAYTNGTKSNRSVENLFFHDQLRVKNVLYMSRVLCVKYALVSISHPNPTEI